MNERECQIIQDLLPLYSDGVTSEASTAMVERHLTECKGCSEALESYRSPMIAGQVARGKDKEGFVSGRIWRRGLIATTCIVFTVSSIAWASYQAGRNLTLRDPSFQAAEELNLFTEVNQSHKLGQHIVTLDKVLLDTARTTLMYRIDPALPGDVMLQVKMTDDKGTMYDPRGGRSLQGKFFVYDLEPVNLDAKRVTLTFATEEMPEEARFEIAVDPTRVAEKTRDIFPGTKATTGPVEFILERAVLGLSASAFHFRIRWPLDPDIAGLAIGEERPMHTVMGPNGPTSAEGRGSRPPSVPSDRGGAGFIPDYWADLVDETNGKRIKLVENRLQTDTVTGGIRGTFYFEPVELSATSLQLKTPPLYLYRFPEEDQVLEITCPVDGEKSVAGVFRWGSLVYTLEKVTVEDKLELYLHCTGAEDKPQDNYRPEFQIKAEEFWREQIGLEWIDNNRLKVSFPQPEEDIVVLKLRSVGEKLPRVAFDINTAE